MICHMCKSENARGEVVRVATEDGLARPEVLRGVVGPRGGCDAPPSGTDRTQGSSEGLVLVAPFDGIGGARRALDITPALYISIETDPDCAQVVLNAWPDAVVLNDVNRVDAEMIKEILRAKPLVSKGLIVGGPPCQGFSGLNAHKKGFGDPRSNGIQLFSELGQHLEALAPQI